MNDSTKTPSELLLGAWRLVSWEARTAGKVDLPHGETPRGQIVYTSSGQMSAQLMNPNAELSDVAGLAPEDVVAQVAKTFFAYYGTYTVDESTRTVTHQVEGSLARSWLGTEQVRAFQFLGDDRLQLSTPEVSDELTTRAGITGSQVLLWERVRA